MDAGGWPTTGGSGGEEAGGGCLCPAYGGLDFAVAGREHRDLGVELWEVRVADRGGEDS
jgi:hypothetical protein